MIKSIYNYKKISSLWATGGQPDEDELYEIGKAGFEVVLNLGLDKAEYSIADEKDFLNIENSICSFTSHSCYFDHLFRLEVFLNSGHLKKSL